MKSKILHLGCGRKSIKGAINVDCQIFPNVDDVVDLSVLPWKWSSDSIDGIYMHHLLEHFHDQYYILTECHRILKPRGFLHLKVPHASCVSSVGCLGHYRTYSFDTLRDYLSRDYYMFGFKLFETTYQRLNWWYEDGSDDNVPKWMNLLIKPADKILSYLANLSPQVCENLWCYWFGGFREVVWRGVKV